MSQAPHRESSQTASARKIHPDALPRDVLARSLDAVLPPAYQGSGRRQALLKLYNNRITRGAVLHWLAGRERMPTWARETLAKALEVKISQLEHDRAIIAPKEKAGG